MEGPLGGGGFVTVRPLYIARNVYKGLGKLGFLTGALVLLAVSKLRLAS